MCAEETTLGRCNWISRCRWEMGIRRKFDDEKRYLRYRGRKRSSEHSAVFKLGGDNRRTIGNHQRAEIEKDKSVTRKVVAFSKLYNFA